MKAQGRGGAEEGVESRDLRPERAGAGLRVALPPPPLLPAALAVEVAAEDLDTYRSHPRPS